MARSLNYLTLTMATGFRCGVVPPYAEVEASLADLDGFVNISLPPDIAQPWQSPTGSMSRDRGQAIVGAIAESMERYSASLKEFPVRRGSELGDQRVIRLEDFSLFAPEQYADPGFPWHPVRTEDAFFGEVYSLLDNEKIWVPQELIGLGSKVSNPVAPSTSTGLAAHFDPYAALLAGVQEVLERDAFIVTWLNSLGGREIPLDGEYVAPVEQRSGRVYCFDLNQAWNPYRVVAVWGYLPQRGVKRIALGVACRQTTGQATEKAYTEWLQGVAFAGSYERLHPTLELDTPDSLSSFEAHAAYYTAHPEVWEHVPLVAKRIAYVQDVEHPQKARTPVETLEHLVRSLGSSGIRMFYRDLTMSDVKETGLTVVRVLSPELSLLHGDERAPFLGGRTQDLVWRYPGLALQAQFPNKYPHPLG